MSSLEINLISFIAGFGMGAIVGELLTYTKRLAVYDQSNGTSFGFVTLILTLAFCATYFIIVDMHSLFLTLIGASLFHLALFAKKKCLAVTHE